MNFIYKFMICFQVAFSVHAAHPLANIFIFLQKKIDEQAMANNQFDSYDIDTIYEANNNANSIENTDNSDIQSSFSYNNIDIGNILDMIDEKDSYCHNPYSEQYNKITQSENKYIYTEKDAMQIEHHKTKEAHYKLTNKIKRFSFELTKKSQCSNQEIYEIDRYAKHCEYLFQPIDMRIIHRKQMLIMQIQNERQMFISMNKSLDSMNKLINTQKQYLQSFDKTKSKKLRRKKELIIVSTRPSNYYDLSFDIDKFDTDNYFYWMTPHSSSKVIPIVFRYINEGERKIIDVKTCNQDMFELKTK